MSEPANAPVPKWTRLSKTEVRYNKFWKFLKIDARLPTGARGTFYVRNTTRAIICALVLTRDRRAVLVKQYRVGPDKVIAELPGGAANLGESPRHAVVREVLEETGYRGKPHFIAASYHEAWNTALRHHFIITDAVKVAGPHFDRYEFGRVVTMSLPQFRRYVRSGGPTDGETAYLGLDYLGLL